MKIADWREAYIELADAYQKATGEDWPEPIESVTNIEHIRSMDDDRLADFLAGWAYRNLAWMREPGEILAWFRAPTQLEWPTMGDGAQAAGKKKAVTEKLWRSEFARLGDAYYHATGEVWRAPEYAGIGITVTDETLADMYVNGGMRFRELADLFGVCTSTIGNHTRAAGVVGRTLHDYPRTELMIEATKKLQFQPGHEVSEKTRAKISAAVRKHYTEFGGYEIRKGGYVFVYVPDHPRASAAGLVAKHRLVMERELGRYLEENEVVHHINHIRDDNRVENLQVMDKQEHLKMHGRSMSSAVLSSEVQTL